MKIKKENKGFVISNCKMFINENRVDYIIHYKEHRIQLKELPYLDWCRRWFPYKNLEIDYFRETIIFAII